MGFYINTATSLLKTSIALYRESTVAKVYAVEVDFNLPQHNQRITSQCLSLQTNDLNPTHSSNLLVLWYNTHPILRSGKLEYANIGEKDPIEWIWEAPLKKVRGIIFLAHGCSHSALDYWDRSDTCPICIGLPEEKRIVEYALQRGYFVLAASSVDRQSKCWDLKSDMARVSTLISRIRMRKELQLENVPFFALGVSSGGRFVAHMPLHIPDIRALVVQVMFVPPAVLLRDRKGQYPPSQWIVMTRDHRTTMAVRRTVNELSATGTYASVIEVPPLPLTPSFFSNRISELAEDVSRDIYTRLSRNGLIDDHGYLHQDPRVSMWRIALMGMSGLNGDTLQSDLSPISEEMNVAYAQHEITADYMAQSLDFFDSHTAS